MGLAAGALLPYDLYEFVTGGFGFGFLESSMASLAAAITFFSSAFLKNHFISSTNLKLYFIFHYQKKR